MQFHFFHGLSMNEDDSLNDDIHLIENLLKNVISRKPEANRQFFSNLPVIIKEAVKNEKTHLCLIAFILEWCDLGDLVSTKTLVDHFPDLIYRNSSKNVFLGFLPLLREVITKCGQAILPELLNFTDYYKEICVPKFIKKKTFPFLANYIDSDMFDIAACLFSFFSRLVPEIGDSNISKLISESEKHIASNFVTMRLSIVDSFQYLVKYSPDPHDFFSKIILSSLSDKCAYLRTHAIIAASKHIELIKDPTPFLELANDSSWKVRFCLVTNIKVFLKAFPEFENMLFTFARNKDYSYEMRESAFYQIDRLFKRLTNLNEALRCVETALHQKDEALVLSALPLIPKIRSKDPSIISSISSLISRFKTSKRENVQLSILKNVVPFIKLTENEKIIVVRWIKSGLESQDWRNVDSALEAVHCILDSENSSILNDDIFQKVLSRLTDNSFNIRNRTSIVLITYITKMGWDFAKEKIMPIVKKVIDDSTLDIFQTTIRFYYGINEQSPPRDIQKEVEDILHKVDKDKVYLLPKLKE
ncbi:hypothetical protein TRFO_09255 [Tritrichomonas foetus]|uniref:HEAT repeat family protein n=1 Tax=Tritrichomonas foetus TaxID=1144522 RepID=A0A1J4JFA4_9EUKA|nr:hypothetical protein TRFO_09255 [Tritrichomonas foetus]|eukprot:OHS97826.1 hypothetical protein TRFO_09255 [Tritrichomonas foetus]